jgi:predicted amidophosphoribosyltransferase
MHSPRSIYCSRCSYDLRNAAGDRCPQCGKPFDPSDRLTYRSEPHTPGTFERLQRRQNRMFVALCLIGLFFLACMLAMTCYAVLNWGKL